MAALLWLLLACVSWTLLGAAFGLLLTFFGPLGNRVVDMLGAPFAWLLRLCGPESAGGSLQFVRGDGTIFSSRASPFRLEREKLSASGDRA